MVVLLAAVTLMLVHLSAKSVLALPVLTDDIDGQGRPWEAMFLPYRSLHPQAAWLGELLGTQPRPHHAHATLPRPQDAERAATKKRGERHPSAPPQESPRVMAPSLPPPRHAKRTEGEGATKNPSVGLGVLSDLRNFFTELRTNLDSVEALAQEQGAASLHPEDLLALLAKEAARTQALAGPPRDSLPVGYPIRSLTGRGAPKDQRYANSGLGK